MIDVLSLSATGARAAMLDSMFRLRHHIFIERLGWPLDATDGRESDQFDHDQARYLVLADKRGAAVAAARLTPTTAPNLLHDVFPYLAEGGEPPRGSGIWEASRLAVEHRHDRLQDLPHGCNPTGELLCAIMEFALARGLSHLVSVSDTRLERVLRRAGWDLRRLGAPFPLGGANVTGEIAPVSTDQLAKIRRRFGIFNPVLRTHTDARHSEAA